MSTRPPRLAEKLFDWYCGAANVDDLKGDLNEWFELHCKTKSVYRARLLYWKQVLSLVFSYAIRKRKHDAQFGNYSAAYSMDMFRNFVKVAVRSLYQYKYFSILNAFGLAVGMSISLLLIAMYSYVKTYDDFHVNQDNIYNIISTRTEGVEQRESATSPILLVEKIKDHPDVVDVTRIQRGFNEEVKSPHGTIPLSGYFVDPNFLNIFTFEVTEGNGSKALAKPNSLIITKSAALKIFNTTDVLGKIIELKDGSIFEIGAVMPDHPRNSHLLFEVLVSHSTLSVSSQSLTDQWTDFNNQYLYVLLSPGKDVGNFKKSLHQISTEIYGALPIKVAFDMQPLREIAMGAEYYHAIGIKWEAEGMIIFGILAALILLPACFNYTNISIARALKRAKEIGLRKTMGSVHHQIFFQFITETIVITLISLVGGLLIFLVIRAEFQSMLVAASSLDFSLTGRMIAMFVAFAIVTGLLAGAFPAFYFARLNPVQALKNKGISKAGGMGARKALTVFQFILSFGFIISLVVFSRQYRYSINFDFGFNKHNLVDVTLYDVKPELFKSEFSKLSSVQSISMSSGILGLSSSRTWVHTGEKDSIEVDQLFIDEHYIPNLGLKFLAGKNFPSENWQRERFIIVNEEFLKAYSIDQPIDAIGRTFLVENQPLEVIGVLKNFHFAPLRYPINKFFFRMNPNRFAYANLNVTSVDAFTMFTQFENTWKKFENANKLKADFFEEELRDGYQMYVAMLKIIGFLGLLAITISLLGMLGMVVYTAESKTKEVGIRKVLGASVSSITYLLSKEYLKLMSWAIVISIPITVVIFDYILSKIQYYSVSISIWDILIGIIILMGLALLTITSQTHKTANMNPAETLKYE